LPVPGIVGLLGGSRTHHSLPPSATNQIWLPARFLKSRVYAKLLTGLFREHYQTFNGQFACCRMGKPRIPKPAK